MSMAEVIKSIEREALREAQSHEIGGRNGEPIETSELHEPEELDTTRCAIGRKSALPRWPKPSAVHHARSAVNIASASRARFS